MVRVMVRVGAGLAVQQVYGGLGYGEVKSLFGLGSYLEVSRWHGR